MSWYTKIKTGSVKDIKLEQRLYLEEKIKEAIDQSLIGGEETIELIDRLIERLSGAHGFRNLIEPSIQKNVIYLLQQAKSVKKDSPQKCSSYLEEALTFLY